MNGTTTRRHGREMTQYIAAAALFWTLTVFGAHPTLIRLASVPRPLPDGKRFVFVWCGDIWIASTADGEARPLTRHPAKDSWPCVSPDGKEIAFASTRDNASQVYAMPIAGGPPEQLTYNKEGAIPLAWFPDGQSILIRAVRDQAGSHAQRFFRVARHGNGREELLFNAYGEHANIAPDGRRILFTRGGVKLYRKGYRGSLASTIWMIDLATGKFQLLRQEPGGCRSPLWRPDGTGFYYVSQADGTFNVWEYSLKSKTAQQRTFFHGDSVILPGLSRNGSTMVFRNLFDFYAFDPTTDRAPRRIPLHTGTDVQIETTRRRWYESIWNNNTNGSLDFTDNGMQICFTTGGDLWVMDTVLRDPHPVTTESGIHETEAVFTPDGQAIVFLRDFGDRVEVWRAERTNAEQYWWQNREFRLTPILRDAQTRSALSVSPDGARIAYLSGIGDLYVAGIDGKHVARVAASRNRGGYDWSPDGKWLACELCDDDGERDIWIVAVDGKRAPYNLSRAPGPDYNPRWSPDGRKIAYIGRRYDDAVDVHYVFLRREDDRKTREERTLDKAIEAMRKELRSKKQNDSASAPAAQVKSGDVSKKDQKEKPVVQKNRGQGRPAKNDTSKKARTKTDKLAASDAEKPKKTKKIPAVHIDFDRLSERIRDLGLRDASPAYLVWKHDSKSLAFRATVKGKRGTYRVEVPDNPKPVFMTEKNGVPIRWIKKGDKILWMLDRLPAHYTKKFPFKVFQYTRITDYQRLAFRLVWRTLRDRFYDPSMNHRDWNAMRIKYEDVAASAPDRDTFMKSIFLLLGELNASHMGFSENDLSRKEWVRDWREKGWNERSGHPGLFFDADYHGPGLKVIRVLPDGPTDRPQSRIAPGEIVVEINGTPVNPDTDLARLLTGRFPRDDLFTVRDGRGKERRVIVHTISYGEVRSLLARDRVRRDRALVEKRSDNRLGYLHVARMRWPDYRKFEKEVYAEGVGKDGLVIDVRGNPGGFVADHLLDVLCHPKHAVTVPRGGGPSYPADYLKKAFWTKPIVVLCDQYTASNGEIFCHAIQTLGRGKIVGVPTWGAVISTGSSTILDEGVLRVPGRGWFVAATGKDMELNGCVPDVVVRARPGEVPAGIDRQLEKAVDVLLEDVHAARQRPGPRLIRAGDRGR